MKKVLRGFAAFAAAASLALSGAQVVAVAQATPATAAVAVAAKKATPAITIRKIPTQTVKGAAKAKIKPLVWVKKGTKVTSKRLRVVHGRKILTRSATSISLKAGTYKVTTTVKYKVGKKARTASKAQALVVKKAVAKKASTRSTRIKGKNCPAGYPVKGNRTGSKREWKYHVRGGQFYNITVPEECFKTTAAARKAGYRASKR